MEDDFEFNVSDDIHRPCGDCECLTEALRDLELQCREAEDECFHASLTLADRDINRSVSQVEGHLARIKVLERRRNYALEVLLKHQALEHRAEE